ncbi:MAG TPA: HNH endonuclease signature motif containing protein [Pseudorhizobium sp.]|nr:HNH endonuclease signature motif containing protein [Pseudorhizobium sp.]
MLLPIALCAPPPLHWAITPLVAVPTHSQRLLISWWCMVRTAREGWHHLYDTAAWKRLRQHQLTMEPLCRFCLEVEDVTEADTVDHVEPHRGQLDLFYDPDNLQSLCRSCHDGRKRRIERGKADIRFDAAGWPVD